MAQSGNLNKQDNLRKQPIQSGQQQGQFNLKNAQNVRCGMDQKTRNLETRDVSDADEQEDADDVTWGGEDEELDSEIQKNKGSRSKNH